MLYLLRITSSFSTIGLIFGLAFFSVSLTPSLLPRDYVVQGVLSGTVFSTGYCVGWFCNVVFKFMELKGGTGKFSRVATLMAVVGLALFCLYNLSQMTVWQNSIRLQMEMGPIETSYQVRMLCIAMVMGLSIVLLMRFLLATIIKAVDIINRFLPRRMATVLGSTFITFLLIFLFNGIIVKRVLDGLDETFAAVNRLLDAEYAQPQNDMSSGSSKSLISWTDIGKNGKRFVEDGPTKDEISDVLGREAMRPIRVYAGFDTGETLEERSQITLAEMQRVGAFNRSTLVIATSTGTGWIDPSAVDSVEFLHAGDITTVTLQYSYLPSWLTLMVEPELAREAASALFNAVYGHWITLPHDKRPKLYLFGLSLGALGAADSLDFITTISDPVNGALWSGPPFLSRMWNRITQSRTSGSPQWRPIFRDSSAIRFMTQDGFADLGSAKWGSLRVVYLQHASDPMTFFSTNLAFKSPSWLGSNRGRDISPYLSWFPIVSFLQVAFDIPMATTVPLGYGHNFAPAEYIDAWIEVTQPKDLSDSDIEKIKTHFVGFNPSPT